MEPGGEQGLLDLVRLPWLMERTAGVPAVRTGLIDGPVAVDHPDLAAGGHVPSASADELAQALRDSTPTTPGRSTTTEP